MRVLMISLVVILLAGAANADAREWRISVVCDAEAREARVEVVNCDANADDDSGCGPYPAVVSENTRMAKADSDASRRLHTPFRIEPRNVTFLQNNPTEFGCRMPRRDAPLEDQSQNGLAAIFLRIERYPTNWNYGGRCGAAPYEALLSIQVGTSSLDFGKPVEKIQLVGTCGWGEPAPISKVTINADTGVISTTPYQTPVE